MCLSVSQKVAQNSRASALHPSNKIELIMCIHHKLCTSEKNMIRTHVGDRFTSEAQHYVMPEWYFTRTRVSRIKCFIADMMEPYVIVKHSPSTPMYDSRFIDYGFNKMSYIEKLRQMNFQMYILNDAFAIDYPHPM